MLVQLNLIMLPAKILDPVQIWEAFCAFSGNTTKVALATNVDVEVVERLAREGNWQSRIQQLDEIGLGNHPEVQKALNRGINYVQTSRLRSLLDKVIRHLSEGSAEDLIDKLTCETAHGPQFKTRCLTDLVKAAEAVQMMSQRALGDVAALQDGDSKSKVSNISLSVLAALNAAQDVGLDSVEVVRKQLASPDDSRPNSPPANH